MISTWQEEFGSTFSPSANGSPKVVRPQVSLGNMPCGFLVTGCGGEGDDALAVRGRGLISGNLERVGTRNFQLSYLGNLQRLRQLSLRVAASPTLESITHNLRNVYKVERFASELGCRPLLGSDGHRASAGVFSETDKRNVGVRSSDYPRSARHRAWHVLLSQTAGTRRCIRVVSNTFRTRAMILIHDERVGWVGTVGLVKCVNGRVGSAKENMQGRIPG